MRHFPSAIEPLEARIAPAAVLYHPLADISAGSVVDLSHLIDPAPVRTQVQFVTNFDIDSTTPGLQPGIITIELYDDLAPGTVANFLSYLNTLNVRGDYDGTFFHRIFDFGAGSDPGVDIIQGGGFESTSLHTHIPTDPPIVNEYREDLQNVRGSLAVAKVGGDPDSATSEWFFNVTDNSSILGSGNNGGFAVFGHVIAGLDVIDKIALSPKTNAGGALTDLPVQNLAANAAVTPANLITITDAKILPGTKADTTGIIYEVVSVTDPMLNPSTLVTPTLSGSDLNLAYAAGQSGIATITVRATQNGMSVTDSFDVTVKANLFAEITSDTLGNLLLPGSTGAASVKLSNNGLATAATNVSVKFYLSAITSTEPDGLTFDSSDILVGELADQQINLATGASVTLSKTIDFSKTQLIAGTNVATDYKLIAVVSPATGSAFDESFTSDNTSVGGGTHKAANLIGTFTDADGILHKNLSLTYTEPDGDIVKLHVTGKGFAEIQSTADGIDILANGTNAQSVLTAKTAKTGHIALHDVQVTSQLGSLAFGQADLTGSVVLSSGVKNITLGDISSDSHLAIGTYFPGNTKAVGIKLGSVHDLQLNSLMPIRSLTAREWLDTTGDHDSISAPSIGTLKITAGDLQADVLSSGNARVGTLSVSGSLENSTVQINGALGKLAIGGTLAGSEIHTGGKIDNVTLGALDHSAVFAGSDTLPTGLDDIGSAAISRIVIQGAFTDSQIAAARLGTFQLKSASLPTGGIIADAIKSYNRTGISPLKNLDTPGTFDALDDYAVTVV